MVRKEPDQARGGGVRSVGLVGCPLPAGQGRTRQAQLPPAALQRTPGHGCLPGPSQPQGTPHAEDGGTGSPAHTAAEMLSSQGRPEPGRTEGKGTARLLGTPGLRGSQGCSVPLSSKVVINVRKVPELSLQPGRGAGPATHPGHWPRCITQQTASAGAGAQPFIPHSDTSCHLQRNYSGSFRITAITWRLLPDCITVYPGSCAPCAASTAASAAPRAEEGARPGVCQPPAPSGSAAPSSFCLHPGGGQENSAACTQPLCPVTAKRAGARMQERGGCAIPPPREAVGRDGRGPGVLCCSSGGSRE